MYWEKADVDNSIKQPYLLIKMTNDCLLQMLGTVMLIIVTCCWMQQ